MCGFDTDHNAAYPLAANQSVVVIPVIKCDSHYVHAGVIFSVGLLEQLSLAAMEECVRGVSSGGGEAFLTECLWTKGYAPTDPGFSLYRPPVRLFDPFQWTGHDDAVQGHGVWEMTNRMKYVPLSICILSHR